jgi:serine protease AprX
MSLFARRSCVLFTVVAAVLLASPAAAQDKPRVDQVLEQTLDESRTSGKKHNVIVRVKAGYTAWLRRELAASGQAIAAEYASIDGLSLELDAKQIAAVCAMHIVDGCSTDADIAATAAPANRGNAQTARGHAVNTMLGNLGLSTDTTAGRGITVALIDSGLFPSKAFDGRIKAFYDFTNGRTRSRKAYDDYGHGTHVAGLIGGLQTTADREYQGVAPGVEFVVLKVLDGNGKGKTSDVIRAIEFAVANAKDSLLGIDVINLSLGHPIFEPAASDPLVRAVEKASKAGIIVVASAGNFGTNGETGEVGYAGTTSPGNAPSAITAGAYNHKSTASRTDDRVAAYSSRGPSWYDGHSKPDVVAPGHYLGSEASPRSGLIDRYPALARRGPSGKAFLALSGTSMAAGVTTGVVALLQQTAADNGFRLTPNLAKAVLQFTAIPLQDDNGHPYDALTQGTGGLNAAGAVQLTRTLNLTVTDIEVAWTTFAPCAASAQACSSTIAGRAEPWAKHIIWGDNIVWGESVYFNLPAWSQDIVWGESDNIVWGENLDAGDNIIWGDNIVWGENIVWGDSIVDGRNIVWGDNIIWGDNIVWGENIVWGDNIVWGESLEDDILWGDNIVWGELAHVAGALDDAVAGDGLPGVRVNSGGRQ